MKFSIGQIVGHHYKTFYNFRTKKVSILDYAVQVGAPLIAAIAINYILCLKINSSLVNIIITSLSIFAGLLLNLLVLIYGISQDHKDADSHKKQLFSELNTNVSYGILVSVVLILLLIVLSIILDITGPATWLEIATGIIRTTVWFLLLQFIFTMLMILKRVYVALRA